MIDSMAFEVVGIIQALVTRWSQVNHIVYSLFGRRY